MSSLLYQCVFDTAYECDLIIQSILYKIINELIDPLFLHYFVTLASSLSAVRKPYVSSICVCIVCIV